VKHLNEICDFCASDDPTWEYPCLDFNIPEISSTSAGSWLACHECQHVIEKEDVDAIVARALHGVMVPPQAEVDVKQFLSILYDAFMRHRNGHPKRLECTKN
jgi:Zn-finger protein